MNEIDPMEMLDEILQKLEAYHPKIETKQEDYISVRLVNDAGKELFIDLEGEFTLFFGDWHGHYFSDVSEYREFLSDLLGILENQRYAVCVFHENQWRSSWLARGETPDIDKIRKKVGDGKKIVCSFWDGSKDVVFQT